MYCFLLNTHLKEITILFTLLRSLSNLYWGIKQGLLVVFRVFSYPTIDGYKWVI